MQALEPQQPQLIEGMPFASYLAIKDVNATGLKNMLVSPRMYRARELEPMDDSDTLRQGRAAHTAILEPDRFLFEYVLWPGKQRRGKEWDAFATANAGKTILTAQQYKTALKMRDAVRACPDATRYLDEVDAKKEMSMQWTHPRTGIRCKGRVDLLCSALVDIKSTRNPDPRRFAADAARLGYAMQAAFYEDGLASLGINVPVKIIAVQNALPFDVVVFNVPPKTLAVGHEQVELALDALVACRKANSWPGLVDGEVDLTLPAWAAPDYDENGPDESQPIDDADF